MSDKKQVEFRYYDIPLGDIVFTLTGPGWNPSGWTAVADLTKCVGCGICIKGQNGCPVEALSFGEDGTIRIDQEKCVGCGICSSRCPHDVIRIKQTMRKDIQEYFLKDYNLDLKLGNPGEN